MNEIEILQRLDAHEAWLKSNRQHGRQLIVEGDHWSGVNLSGRDLADARLSGTTLVECRFQQCVLTNVAFLSSRFKDCRLIGCRLLDADLRGVVAERCDFTGSDLTRADLTDAVLAGCVLTDCVLDWSWLVRTDLRSAHLTGVHFEHARLLRTKLYNEGRFAFARPVAITAKELDVSRDGDASLLAGIEGLERLLAS